MHTLVCATAASYFQHVCMAGASEGLRSKLHGNDEHGVLKFQHATNRLVSHGLFKRSVECWNGDFNPKILAIWHRTKVDMSIGMAVVRHIQSLKNALNNIVDHVES